MGCQPFSTKKSSLLIEVNMYGVFWWHINDILELWHPHDTNKVVVMWMHHSIKNKVIIFKFLKVWWIFPNFSNFFLNICYFFPKTFITQCKNSPKKKGKNNTTSKLDKLILWFKHPFFMYFLFYYNGFYYKNLASSTFHCWIIPLFWKLDVKS